MCLVLFGELEEIPFGWRQCGVKCRRDKHMSDTSRTDKPHEETWVLRWGKGGDVRVLMGLVTPCHCLFLSPSPGSSSVPGLSLWTCPQGQPTLSRPSFSHCRLLQNSAGGAQAWCSGRHQCEFYFKYKLGHITLPSFSFFMGKMKINKLSSLCYHGNLIRQHMSRLVPGT